MSLNCGCEEMHYFLELDDNFAKEIWSDSSGILKGQGIATLASIGDAEEDEEEEEHVSIEPEAFLAWLDELSAKRAAIRERLRGGQNNAWNEADFAREVLTYRELAEHAREVGTSVEAGWA